ncbi:MAG: histidine--tRNA ligase [Planctomycetota bacterium]|nr:MAG: histidine--tRNA ligase [Planctomycetota bacterium]
MGEKRIQPRTLKGFRDYLPSTMLAREQLIDTARAVYRSYGFAPIDTPALEYSEILLGKGGEESDKQLFRFRDQGDRDVAMRFDLTVPLARFVAMYANDLGVPFKRYHIGTVWRAEKPQRGRFREFVQCDFDTIGTTSNTADIETLLVIHDLMDRIGFERFEIRVNNRMILNGLLEQLGLRDRSTAVLRALDKLPKAGPEAVRTEMQLAGLSHEDTNAVLEFARRGGEPDDVLRRLRRELQTDSAQEGIERLAELFRVAQAAGVREDRLRLDLSIARGLDYYTGTIYETFLLDLPQIGSVCSGGRYDQLAELFTRQQLPGVGASLGLDRLLAAMEELGMLDSRSTPCTVFVPLFDPQHTAEYLAMARRLRSRGLAVDVYPDPKPLGKQLKYADRKGFLVAVIAGEDEFARGVWQVKDLVRGTQNEVPDADLADAVIATLGAHPQ